MKKKLLPLLLAWISMAVAFAGKEDLYVLHQGFEDGIPADWTQVYLSSYQQPWAVESADNATYPKGAFAGSKYAALRNNTSQTQYFVTRLVTPVFNIQDVVQPILVFSHAQVQRTGDKDTLRVYYRSSASSRWVMLREYAENISQWRTDTIALTAKTATYQLAFEGTDNFGRGIVLDEIIVRPKPTCINPSNISADSLTTNSATIRWMGSLDADEFHLLLAREKQNDPDNPMAVDQDLTIPAYQYTFNELQRNVQYYVYIQSRCGGDVSDWVEYSFHTKNSAPLPYEENFDRDYAANTVAHVDYWVHGTSIKKEDGEMDLMPYINRNIRKDVWRNYSYSSTTCLVFSGACDDEYTTTLVPAGQYVYAAAPEFQVSDIRDLEVTFWGMAGQYVGANYASGLVVGVMTDPNDFHTFVPVDTVFVTQANTFNRFTVYLENYVGKGKYIAFASNFKDKHNIFYMDDLRISEKQSHKMITNVRTSDVRGAAFSVDANLNGNTRFQLIVARDTTDARTSQCVLDPSTLPADYILFDKELNASELPYRVQLPKGGLFVQVYLCPINETTHHQYSLPVKVLVPMSLKSGHGIFIGFEEDEAEGIWTPVQLTNFRLKDYNESLQKYSFAMLTSPINNCYESHWLTIGGASYSAVGHNNSSKAAELLKRQDEEYHCTQPYGDYLALPECESLDSLVMHFYMRPAKDVVKFTNRVAVGMMTDPMDPSTFEQITTCEVEDNTYRAFSVLLSAYQGKGRFPAIMAVNAQNRYKNSNSSDDYSYVLSAQYIDDISLFKATGCAAPTDIHCEPSYKDATISWNGDEQAEYIVCLYSDAAATQLLDSIVVKGCKCVVDTLSAHTAYYYSVAPKCNVEGSSSVDIHLFTTTCAPYETIPYFEDFESWTGGSKVEEPLCWTTNRVYLYETYYPYVEIWSRYAHSGDKSLLFSHYNDQLLDEPGYIALPPMEDAISRLQMSFYARPGDYYVGDTLFVGVMSDPMDVTTFQHIDTCILKTNSYQEFIVRFDDYQGTGKHIAFWVPKSELGDAIYIDDIKVDYLSDCEKIQNVSTRNATTVGADIYWTKGKTTTWNVLLATSGDLSLGSSVVVDGVNVLSVDTVSQMPYRLTKCPNTNETYYVYVRAVCSESKGEWSIPTSFRTICSPILAGDLGLVPCNTSSDLDCWTLGCRVGSKTPDISSSSLRIYNATGDDGAYAIMRPMDVDSITRLQISFDAHGGTDDSYLREITVGIVTNASDLSTFSAVKTLSLNKVSANTAFDEARHYIVRFDTYTGDYNGDYGKQIMFLSESGDKKNYVYIRNIRIDTIGKCLEPVEIKVSDVEAYGASASWEQLGDSYQVQLFKAADDTKIVDTTMNVSSIQFANLAAVTSYRLRVRHICAEGDTSNWSGFVPFKTACPVAYPLPYVEDFDNLPSKAIPDCWEAYSTSNSFGASAGAAKDGNMGLRMDRSTSSYSYAVLPKVDAFVGDLMLSFDYKKAESSYNGYLVVGIATDITSEDSIASTLTVLDSIYVAKTKKTWLSYNRILSSYNGADGHIVLWAPKADKRDNRSYFYVDNIRVEKAPTCLTPNNISFKTSSTSSVTITWTPLGKESTWDIACVAKGGNIADATIVTTQSTTGVVSGLTSATEYDLYVRANCGNDDVSEWSTPISCTTLTIVNLADAHWNFDDRATQQPNPNYSSNTAEKGWIISTTASSAYKMPNIIRNSPYYQSDRIASRYALSDSCALKFGSSGYAILPEIDADLNNLQLRFFGRAVYAMGSMVQDADSIYVGDTKEHNIQVGVLADPYDWSTLELLIQYDFKMLSEQERKTIVPDGHWEEVIVPLHGVKGKYIVLFSEKECYIDNVVVEKEGGCLYPTLLQIDTLTAYQGTVSWQSSKQAWQVRAWDTSDSIIDEAVVNTNTWTTNRLSPATKYYFSVRAICSEGDSSAWTISSIASTPCAPATMEDFSYDFEKNLVADLPACWASDGLVKDWGFYVPQVVKNNKDSYQHQYSRRAAGNTHALQFTAKDKEYNSYVILPETDFEYDSVSLHFWMRAARFHSPEYTLGPNQIAETTEDFKRDLIMGTITDLNDFNTFVAMDTITYSRVFESSSVLCTDDSTGNDYWEEVFVPLAKYANKGRLVIYYPGKPVESWNSSYMYIDDMDVVHNSYCFAPNNLRASDIHSNSAVLSWLVAGVDSLQLQLATTDTYDSVSVVIDTVLSQANGRFVAKQLRSNYTYYFRLRHLCGEDEASEWAGSTAFTTAAEIRFSENFSALRTYPNGWLRGDGDPEKVLAGVEPFTVSQDGHRGWERNSDHCVIANNEMVTATTTSAYTENNHWLVTPVIDLSSVSINDTLMLSFRLGLTGSNGGHPNPVGDKDKFIVAVSEDLGSTWPQENAVYWSDLASDNPMYSYSAIPETGMLYHLDMSKYIGKRIKIAFISASTSWPPANNSMRLAQVQLNTVRINKYAAAICGWTDYEDENFFIDATGLNVDSVMEYQNYRQASVDGVKDTYSIMQLTVNRVPETTIEDKVCEGEDYTKYNFSITNNRTSKTYRQKLSGSQPDGCDSIVTLNLTVTPRLREDVHQTICQGNYYEFNGTKYYTSTVHADTLSSLVSGCDSIVTLYLNVNDMLAGESTAHICAGEFIDFGKFGKITEEGTYVDTIQNSLGCDSVATLHVSIHQPVTTISRAVICQGERYTKDNWTGLTTAGVYTNDKLKTVYGCDSIVSLHLMVAGADMAVLDSIASDQLPYILDGIELLPVGTEEGTYTKEVAIRCGTATLTIIVGVPSALQSVFANGLTIVPNPVDAGRDIIVSGMFSGNASLKVLSATGACVYRMDQVQQPTVIPGIFAAGVYMVTITDGDQLYQSKLIVK